MGILKRSGKTSAHEKSPRKSKRNEKEEKRRANHKLIRLIKIERKSPSILGEEKGGVFPHS